MKNVTVKRVENLANNQIIIYLSDETKIFNSYGKNIVLKDKEGNTTLDSTYWNYSNTTSKYRCQFLNELGTETQKKIKSGVYKLAELN